MRQPQRCFIASGKSLTIFFVETWEGKTRSSSFSGIAIIPPMYRNWLALGNNVSTIIGLWWEHHFCTTFSILPQWFLLSPVRLLGFASATWFTPVPLVPSIPHVTGWSWWAGSNFPFHCNPFTPVTSVPSIPHVTGWPWRAGSLQRDRSAHAPHLLSRFRLLDLHHWDFGQTHLHIRGYLQPDTKGGIHARSAQHN